MIPRYSQCIVEIVRWTVSPCFKWYLCTFRSKWKSKRQRQRNQLHSGNPLNDFWIHSLLFLRCKFNAFGHVLVSLFVCWWYQSITQSAPKSTDCRVYVCVWQSRLSRIFSMNSHWRNKSSKKRLVTRNKCDPFIWFVIILMEWLHTDANRPATIK